MPATLSLACVNIEKSRHLHRVRDFMLRTLADVFCIQELYEKDIEYFASVLKEYSCVYEPSTYDKDISGVIGVGIFSRLPIIRWEAVYYRGIPTHVPTFDRTDVVTRSITQNHMILKCNLEKGGTHFCACTTHFTWTPDGKAESIQRHDLAILLDELNAIGEFVLCGDFNAPRGGEIFDTLSSRFRDNIPSHYATSIDPHLHRAGPLELMVDGLFTTPRYAASNVVLHSGISDHCAITAEISTV